MTPEWAIVLLLEAQCAPQAAVMPA